MALLKHVLLIIALGVCPSGCGGSTSSSTPAATAEGEAALDGPPEWQTVIDWSGSGIKQTESFAVGSREWRIYWKTKNEAFPGAGGFQVAVHQAETDAVVASAGNSRGTGRDFSYVRTAPGRYYLSINSANVDWLVRVQDQRPITDPPPAPSKFMQEFNASFAAHVKAEASRRKISEEQSLKDNLTMSVGTFINNGFITDMDDDLHAFYLGGDFWRNMGRDQNEMLLSQFANFRNVEKGLMDVVVYDSKTEQELASYTRRQGPRFR